MSSGPSRAGVKTLSDAPESKVGGGLVLYDAGLLEEGKVGLEGVIGGCVLLCGRRPRSDRDDLLAINSPLRTFSRVSCGCSDWPARGCGRRMAGASVRSGAARGTDLDEADIGIVQLLLPLPQRILRRRDPRLCRHSVNRACGRGARSVQHPDRGTSP